MRIILWPALLTLFACEPPPRVDLGGGGTLGGLPSVEIVYPRNGDVLELEADCSLEVPLALDLTNFTLQDPFDTDGPVENEGHFHAEPSVTPGVHAVAFESAILIALSADDLFSGGQPDTLTMSISVDLVDNDHLPLDGTGTFDLVEFDVTPPADPCVAGTQG